MKLSAVSDLTSGTHRDIRWPTWAGFVCMMLLVSPTGGQTPDATTLEKVNAGPPTRKTLQWYSNQPARLTPDARTPIHAKVAGYVREVHVDFGDRVKAGTPLVTLDVPELLADVARKEAQARYAKAFTRQAEAGIMAAEAAFASAQARQQQAEASMQKVIADVRRRELESNRWKQLSKSGAANQQVAEEAQLQLDSALSARQEVEAAIASAKADVKEQEALVNKAKTDADAARAQEQIAEAELRVANVMQGYTVLLAPYDGVITDRRVDPGHFVQPGSGNEHALLVVDRIDRIRAIINIPEQEAPSVTLGSVVTFTSNTAKGLEFQGTVTRTSWALREDNRSLETIIELENPEERLRPGMFASAKLLLAERPGALTVPNAAVVQGPKSAHCFRIMNGQTTQTAIKLGIRVGDDWEVIEGIQETDTIALNKAASLRDGQRIEAVPIK